MSEQPRVLAVNAGSSSLKFGLYVPGGECVWSGQFTGLEPGGTPQAPFATKAPAASSGLEWALEALRAHLDNLALPAPAAVVHRVVHGGAIANRIVELDSTLLTELGRHIPEAPLHQPFNLSGLRVFADAFPDTPQLVCCDTAFHADLPALEQCLPLPAALHNLGLRRFGFHGLSYEHALLRLHEAGAPVSGRVLLAHLGSGASVCATVDGKSVATSMGFSALDGLMMSTRSGSIDPGVVLHLMRAGWTADRIEALLYRESGLLGVSGLSGDWQTLRATTDPRAHFAIALFTHRLRRELGAQLGLLGGVDAIVFTGGIGARDAVLRAQAVAALASSGLRLDQAANTAASGDAMQQIQAPDSCVQAWIVPADEGRMAALHAWEWLARVN